MALNVSALDAGLLAVFTSYPSTTIIAATNISNAYDSYASTAQACSLLNPTVVDLTSLTNQLITSFGKENDTDTAAQEWADAFEAYWTGGQFGATGSVVAITGNAALKNGLKSLWESQAANESTTFADSATAHANLLHTFTQTVNVLDTAVPPPSGCGPAPIY